MKQNQNIWDGSEKCKSCSIRHLVLFSDLNEQDFSQIHRPIDDISYKPMSTIYQQKDKLEFVYTIKSGLVKLVQYLPNGRCRIVRILGQGELLGIESLNHQLSEHTAITLNHVELCRIPHSVINMLQQQSVRLHGSLITRWQNMLTMADLWITQLSTGKIKSRVARILVFLADKSQDENIFLPTREDIGGMLGITTESASKVTAEFKRKGFLKLLKNNRAWIDKDKLAKL